MDKLLIYVLIIFALGILGRVRLRRFSPSKPDVDRFRYYPKNPLTPRECAFFKRLESAVGDRYYIFPQVHLSSLANHMVRGQSWRSAKSHIDRKSVDYVLCDKSTFGPVLAVELDDPTHRWPDRAKNDRTKDRILRDIGLPILRVDGNSMPDAENLALEISGVVSSELQGGYRERQAL